MMQDAATIAPLLWLVGAQLGLYAIGWVVVGALLGEDREAVVHWGVFLLLLAVGLLLAGARTEERLWWTYSGVNVITLIGFAAVRRGTERFMRVPSSDREQLVMLALVAGAMAVLGPAPEHSSARIVLAYAGQGYIIWRMNWALREPVRAEFGVVAYRVVVVPGMVIGTLLVLLAVRQLLSFDVPQEMQANNGSNVALMYVYLFGCALFNFGFMVFVTQRLVLKLRRASRQDALTGLFNRGAIDAELRRLWAEARAAGRPLALMLVDVDHFKRINDGHGHAAGDRVLAHVAGVIGATGGAAARVGRYGGEEFLVLLPGHDAAVALCEAETMRAAVAAEAVQLRGQALAVTLSIGVAEALPGDSSLDDLLARADAALYRAKAGGRNRVEAGGAVVPPAVADVAA